MSADQFQPTEAPWCTLVMGKLVQKTPLTVAGSEPGDSSLCYRDGNGNLVLPGTSIGGLLVESAARIIPSVVDDDSLDYCITNKSRSHKKIIDDGLLRSSVWLPYSCWLLDPGSVQTSWQQGVGINQKTRTTARKVNALYEQECVPADTEWSFFLEIDSCASPISRSLAIATLKQWVGCWAPLGRAPTRGNGFFELVDAVVYDLNRDHIGLWPANQFDPSLEIGRTQIKEHLSPVDSTPLVKEMGSAVIEIQELGDKAKPWCFARFQFEAEFGNGTVRADNSEEYGLEALSVSGHESLLFEEGADFAWYPDLVSPIEADSPFAASCANGVWKPAIGGGGIRGPIRHATSALARGTGFTDLLDPNNSQDRQHSMFQQLTDLDPVNQFFGWMSLPDDPDQLSSRFFVWESLVDGASTQDWLIVRSEHHAEDEFRCGTFASAKYNRDTMLKGKFKFTFQLESPAESELIDKLELLRPAMLLAKLGFIGLGGCKAVAGYTPWKFVKDSAIAVDTLGTELNSTKVKINSLFGDD